MASTDAIKRLLLSLPDSTLRVAWIRDRFERWPDADGARLLNALLEQSEGAVADAREIHLALAMLIVRDPDGDLADRLRSAATELSLFSLARLVRRAPPARSYERKVEDLPIPDYGTGRELTLGERRSLARRPNRSAFDRLLSDPHPMVIGQLLENPKLVEDDAIRLATRRPAQHEVLRELAQSPKWIRRARVRLAILFNPGTPAAISLPLVGLCNRGELREIVQSTTTLVILRATARELLDRRPPMEPGRSEHPTLQ